jgi:hypothetical protein
VLRAARSGADGAQSESGVLMQKNSFKIVGSILVIIGTIVFLCLSMTPGAPIIDKRPFEALGQVAAEEAQAYIGKSGGRIALILRDTRLYPNPQMDAMRAAFIKTCAQKDTVIIATNLVKVDPLNSPRVPLGDYQELFIKLTEKDVIVSFMGPPVLTSVEDRQRFPVKGPKVVALCLDPIPRQVNLKSLFSQNLLHTAIINRAAPDAGLPKGGTSRAWFDHFYQILTSSNLGDMPASLEFTGYWR